MSSFRMFRAPGQPGHYYGYAEIDGVTYKIDAVTIGKNLQKRWEGTIKRHLKADQQKLPLVMESNPPRPSAVRDSFLQQEHQPVSRYGSPEAAADCSGHKGSPCMKCGWVDPDFDDKLPEKL